MIKKKGRKKNVIIPSLSIPGQYHVTKSIYYAKIASGKSFSFRFPSSLSVIFSLFFFFFFKQKPPRPSMKARSFQSKKDFRAVISAPAKRDHESCKNLRGHLFHEIYAAPFHCQRVKNEFPTRNDPWYCLRDTRSLFPTLTTLYFLCIFTIFLITLSRISE